MICTSRLPERDRRQALHSGGWGMVVSTSGKLVGLQVATGFVVAFVRHNLETHRLLWNGFEPFLVSWFIHTIAVVLLMAIVLVPILSWQRFFIGQEFKGFKDQSEELQFHITMTVLVAAVCIFFVAHWVP